MAAKLKALKLSGKENPDTLYAQVVLSNAPAGYVTGGDPLSMAAKDMTDPNGVAPIGPNNLVPIAVGVMQEELGGNYAQVVPAATLAGFKVKFYQPGGAELAQANYPAAILNGTLILEIVLNDSDE